MKLFPYFSDYWLKRSRDATECKHQSNPEEGDDFSFW